MEDCPICYEAVDKSTGHCTLACNHSFHINCLTTWSAKEPTCPMCRHELGEKEVAVKRQKIEPWGWLSDYNITIEDNGITVQGEPSQLIRIGSGIEVSEADVQAVMNVGATRGNAIRALRLYHGSVDLAIDEVLSPPSHPTRMVPAPRYPVDDPSEDQTMSWALHRMFDETYTTYKWNSYSDMRTRTRPYFYGKEEWMNQDIHNLGEDDLTTRGYESA